MERFYLIIIKYPRTVIGVIVILTVFFGWQIRNLQFNNSLESVLPENHPSLIQDHELKKVFNSREFIIVGLVSEEGIFKKGSLQKVKDLSDSAWNITIADQEDLEELKGWSKKLGESYSDNLNKIIENGLDRKDRQPLNIILNQASADSLLDPGFKNYLKLLQIKLSPVSDVVSLSTVDNISGNNEELAVKKLMQKIPETTIQLQQLKSEVYGNRMYINGLVSEDGTGTAVLVELSFYYDDHLDLAFELFEKLNRIAKKFEGPESIHLAGVPMVNVYTSNYMNGDLARMVPVVILVVFAVMYFSFRSVSGALIPLGVVLTSLIWTLGTMAILDRPVTLVVSAMPIILIAIGVADGIHLFSEYRHNWDKRKDKKLAVLATMKQLSGPVLFTSLTDMAGFGSLAFSSLRSIKDFGIFTSVGALAALIFSLTFIPAALILVPPPKRLAKASAHYHNRIELFLEKLGRFSMINKTKISIGIGLLVIVGGIAISNIQIGSTMVGYFKKKSEIYQASQMLNNKFGGTEVMNIVIDAGKQDGLKDPQILQGINRLQDTLEAMPLVGYTTSLANYVKRINFVMHSDDPAYSRIPRENEEIYENQWVEKNGEQVREQVPVTVNGRDQIGQYLFLYENEGGDDLEKLTDFDYSKANIVAQIRTDDTPKLKRIKDKAEAFAVSVFGETATVTFAGCSTLCVVADTLIIPSQLKSLGMALLVVLILLSFTFRSFRLGIFGLMPLLLTIIMVFTIMSIASINLDSVTALVASIVLGVGIDYSVHFISRYKHLTAQGFSREKILHEIMHTSGRAIVLNSIAVALGFAVLMFSSFWPVINIGWMVAVNMIVGAAFVLVLLPILLLGRHSLHVKTKSKNIES